MTPDEELQRARRAVIADPEDPVAIAKLGALLERHLLAERRIRIAASALHEVRPSWKDQFAGISRFPPEPKQGKAQKWLGKTVDEWEEIVDDYVSGERMEGQSDERMSTSPYRGGMELTIDMGNVDSHLKGWWGVNTGDANDWMGILAADGYIDESEPAYVYDIKVDDVRENGGRDPFPVFFMSDPFPMDKGNTPDSRLLFAPVKKLPSSMIKQTRVIRPAELTKARKQVDRRR